MSLSIEHAPASAAGTLCRLIDVEKNWEYSLRPRERVLRRRPDLGLASSYDKDHPSVTSFVLDQYRAALNALFSFGAEWMNPVTVDRRLDQNKLLGSAIAASVGLRTIPTVMTDSPKVWSEAVERFAKRGDIAVKAAAMWAAKLDGTNNVVSLFTQRLSASDARAMAELVRHAPVIVQPYIEKAYELRITAVDSRLFTCRIDSQASRRTMTDWRHYDLACTPHTAVELETTIAERLRGFMRASGMRYAAIDMIVHPSGAHYFVEANPAGQFGWIEELTGLRISDAIADWLTVGVSD